MRNIDSLVGKLEAAKKLYHFINDVDRVVCHAVCLPRVPLDGLEFSHKVSGPQPEVKNLNAAELRDFLAEAQARLSVIQTPNVDPVAGNPDFTLDDFTPYESDKRAHPARH